MTAEPMCIIKKHELQLTSD